MGDAGPTKIRRDLEDSNFPAATYLGTTLDLTTLQLGKIKQIINSANLAQTYIGLGSGDTTPQPVLGGSWDVPSGVCVFTDVVSGTSQNTTYASGTDVVQRFSTNSSLTAAYQGVCGSPNVSTLDSEQFSSTSMYSLDVFETQNVSAVFTDYMPNINDQNLANYIGSLPPFDATNAVIVSQYWQVFRECGSHVITGVVYGGRFYLKVAQAASEDTQFSQFQVDVETKYQAVLQSSANPSVIGTAQYNNFCSQSEPDCEVTGGDTTIAGQIQDSPSDATPSMWQQWVDSVTEQTSPDVVSFHLDPIWTVMSQSTDPTISCRQNDFENAFNYIIGLPFSTPCLLTVDTDYAGVTLLSQGFIAPVPGYPYSNEMSVSNNWCNFRSPDGKPVSGVKVPFLVGNDGSPFTLSLKYGSGGQHFAFFTVNGGTTEYGPGCKPNNPTNFSNLPARTGGIEDIYTPNGWTYNPS